MKVSGMGAGKSDEWMTPPEVFEALGEYFDVDVAAPVGGPLHVPCRCYFPERSLERFWYGFVWMNPPFGGRNAKTPWMDKFFAHGNGIALTPDRTSAPWFREAWPKATAVLFGRKTPFLLPNGESAGSPPFGTTLWAAGERAAFALQRASERGLGFVAIPGVAVRFAMVAA